jgi:hypothetical protein
MIVRIHGTTQGDRHSVTAAASDGVCEAGGYVLDYNQFSNLAVCFTIELPPDGFAKLRRRLTEIGVVLETPTEEEVAASTVNSDASAIVPGSLRLDFRHSEPDLRIPIPSVPG